MKAPAIFHKNFGIGIDSYDIERREKKKVFTKKALHYVKKLEMYAEEQRILYVALTRAKEKLIITGAYKGGMESFERRKGESPDTIDISKAKRELHWAPAFCNLRDLYVDYKREWISKKYHNYHYFMEGQQPANQ